MDKPPAISGLFQDRHVMQDVKFDYFYSKALTDSLTSSEITTLENWRK